MRSAGSEPPFRYKIQRVEREYNWVLFWFLTLLTVSLVILSVNVQRQYGNSMTSYMVMPLSASYHYVRETFLSWGGSVMVHFETARDLSESRQENEALRREVAERNLLLTRYRGMADLWQLHLAFPEEATLPAAVVGRGDSPLRREAILDRGQGDGVSKYMPAVVPGASGEPVLVGCIAELRPHAALLRLISDPEIKVEVIVAGRPGTVVGSGDGCLLSVDKQHPLPEGATVETAGDAGVLYPPGLLVGWVSHERAGQGSLARQYELLLPRDLDRVRDVLLLPSRYRDDALDLEAPE